MDEQNKLLLNETQLKDKIYIIRGVQVMLDSDLADIYGYTTKRLNEQVSPANLLAKKCLTQGQ